MRDGGRSAVIVPFALPPGIEAMRRENVPVATAGVPPHITLLFPFIPAPELGSEIRARLADAIRGIPPFDVRFRAVAQLPDALYLAPEPAAPFRALITAVCLAFPALPPYADPTLDPSDVEPHLTIALGDGARFDVLAADVRPALPFTRRATAVAVLAESDGGTWRTRWRLALRS
jgi:2'-5' RNA ligase